MIISDALSGIFLIVFGLLSLSYQRAWAGWAIGLIGIWLQFAPLVFWEPSPMMYINSTIVGIIALILCFNLNESTQSAQGVSVPKGWSFNPSSWAPRILTVGLALICWFISRYLAAFQLGYIDHMTDPFFKDGTLHVITSQISKDFPVADAGLGALGYTLEFVLGWQGSSRRWSEMPWLVVAYGILVIPVSVASIALIILQPVAVGAWCSWCLGIALIMLVMIILTAPELAAVTQLLFQTKREGKPFWKVFWNGVSARESAAKKNQGRKIKQQAWGITLPWTLLASFVFGIWLMISPALLNSHNVVAISNYIGGPLVSTFSIIALAEAFRSIRLINILLGAGLILAPWLAPSLDAYSVSNNVVVGLLIIALALPKGKIHERYGSWEKMII
jgi:uncharacterized membrane protein